MKPLQKSQKTIDSILHGIIKESMKNVLHRRALLEQDEASPVDQDAADDEKKKMKKGDIEAKDIIEKLNSIRAGKSFKDKDISDSLKKYVDDMSTAEKTALFTFLKGISQIVTGEFDAQAAVEPSDKPAGIEMKKKESGGSRTIKPQIVKQEKTKKEPAAEDTSGPVPIKPKTSK